MTPIPDAMSKMIRIPYALRLVPEQSLARLLPCPQSPQAGDIALARLEKVGKNARLELASGRASSLHEGDMLAVVFGNRYATEQFEGYARADGDMCDLMSMAGLCGLVVSRHASIGEPTKLRLLGALGDEGGRPLRLQSFAVAPASCSARPPVIVVCGTAMDAGKTHTAKSLIVGLKGQGFRVASVKLTGTAAGRDTWAMLDAGAYPALDFIDGGLPSTYLCDTEELLGLHELLAGHAASFGVDWLVVEIADGLLQRETSSLLTSRRFAATVHGWVLAAGEPLAAVGAVAALRAWGIEPLAVSGRVSMGRLGVREVEAATGLPCLGAGALQRGDLSEYLLPAHAAARATPPSADGAIAAAQVA